MLNGGRQHPQLLEIMDTGVTDMVGLLCMYKILLKAYKIKFSTVQGGVGAPAASGICWHNNPVRRG